MTTTPANTADAIFQFKQTQKEGWKYFAPLEAITTSTAARLVHFAGIQPGMRVLDAGCGTGVVAITAARLGATVKGADLTPQLLDRARENALIAKVNVEWTEADVEQLPFGDGEFDAVLSQFAHMFAPRPEVAIREMLRVLRPEGTIAFSTWPPELLVGRTMMLASRYMPPPPPGVSSPMLWGEPGFIQQQLGNWVDKIVVDRQDMLVPTLSPQHFRTNLERSAGPVIRLIDMLAATSPEGLEAYRQEFDAIVAEYMQDNVVRQGYLMTRARKL
jgi:ubiquinone/menaquinone biosynthesis C-methylase UbiE